MSAIVAKFPTPSAVDAPASSGPGAADLASAARPSASASEPASHAIAVPETKAPSLPKRPGQVLRQIGGFFGVVVPPIALILILMGVWQLACQDPTSLFPGPLTIWQNSKELIVNPFFDRGGLDKGLFWHVATSLSRVAIGFSIAAFVGVLLGVWVGVSKIAHRAFDPLFQILRTVPPLAWLPISLAIFKMANPSALFVIFMTSIWPVIINTAVGIRNLNTDYMNIGKVLRLSSTEMFFKIMAPAATPYIFTGLRIGVGMSWLAIVASEMLLGGVGIGFFIWDQYNASRISDIIVALVWVGGVGFLLDRFVAFLGNLASRGSSLS